MECGFGRNPDQRNPEHPDRQNPGHPDRRNPHSYWDRTRCCCAWSSDAHRLCVARSRTMSSAASHVTTSGCCCCWAAAAVLLLVPVLLSAPGAPRPCGVLQTGLCAGGPSTASAYAGDEESGLFVFLKWKTHFMAMETTLKIDRARYILRAGLHAGPS